LVDGREKPVARELGFRATGVSLGPQRRPWLEEARSQRIPCRLTRRCRQRKPQHPRGEDAGVSLLWSRERPTVTVGRPDNSRSGN
jgi:hypothetical protein